MLNKRIATVAVIIPVSVTFVVIGGWPFFLFICAILGISTWEYWRMFKQGGFSPNPSALFAGVLLLAAARNFEGFNHSDWIITLIILAAMTVHTIMYEQKREQSATDFGITLAGIFYIGWLGSYFLSVRQLPNGLWWLLFLIPVVGIGDAGAYFIGNKFGKTKMAPKVSPNKTWEGYFGGILFATIGGAILASLWQLKVPVFNVPQGLLFGLILGVLTPLGDMGESMLKRQFNLKDTSQLLPGHGGFLDRIDTWLWSAAIGYYLITWFV